MSILQFATTPLPPWCRIGRYGTSGAWAMQIDMSGLDNRNRVLQRSLTPITTDVTVQTRLHIKSTAVTYNSIGEGIAARHRGYSLEGAYPNFVHRQVWDSSPATRGESAWLSRQTDGFETVSFMTPISSDHAIDELTLELVCRGESGQATLMAFETRHHYGRLYDDIEFTDWVRSSPASGGGMQQDFRDYPGDGNGSYKQYVRYLNTRSIRAIKGQTIHYDVEAVMRAVGLQSSTTVAIVYGFIAKLRRKGTGTYDYFDIGTRSDVGGLHVHANSFSKRLRYDYDQEELLIGIRAADPDVNLQTAFTNINFTNAVIGMRLSDFVGGSG